MAWNEPDPATTIEPDSTCARRLVDRIRLAGEQRFVDLEPVALIDHAVGQHLVSGLEAQQVVEHDIADCHLLVGAVPHHPRAGRVQHRELIERAWPGPPARCR